MSKVILESVVNLTDVSVEDGGRAKIANVSGNPEEDEGLYVRLISWSENRSHPDFDKLVGHRVRVTIETLD
jgi:hypothetical protein